MFLHYSYMGRRKETNQNLYTVMDSPITWNDDYGKTMKHLCAQSFEIKDTRFRKKKKIPHVFLYKAAHGLAMAPWRHTWQTWTPNPTVPEKDGQVTQCHKKNTSLGQPPPKKLQHLIQSPLHFRQRSLSWDCHPSCSAIFINCHKRSSAETSVDASQNSWVLCPGCLEHRWFGIAGPLSPNKNVIHLGGEESFASWCFHHGLWHFPRYTHFYILVGFMTGFFMGNFRIHINLGVLLPNLIHKMS